MAKPKLAVVIGSIRTNRFADHPAQWIADIAGQSGKFDVELIDLKDYPLPLFAEAVSPAYAPSKDEVAQRWQKKVAEFDAYVFTAAEYNRGPTAVLKNALDYSYQRNGPTSRSSFVGYGGVGGARAVEQLRLNAIELQMAPIRTAVHIQMPVYLAVAQGRQEARRLRFPQPECQGHAGPAGLVDQRAEGGARDGRASGGVASSSAKARIGVRKESASSGRYRRLASPRSPLYAPRLRPVRHGAEPRRSIRKSMKALTLGA